MSFATDCEIVNDVPKYLRKDIIEYYVKHAPDAVSREYKVRYNTRGRCDAEIDACSNVTHGVMKGGFMIGGILSLAACGQVVYKIGKGVYKLVKFFKR